MTRCKNYYAGRALLEGFAVEISTGLGGWVQASQVNPNIGDYQVLSDYEGWLPWYGGECPVSGNTKLQYKTDISGISGVILADTLYWSDSVFMYRIVKKEEEVDPYAKLKAATQDQTKQLYVYGDKVYPAFDGEYWFFAYPPEVYEVRDKPKPTRKIKLLAWLTSYGGFIEYAEGSHTFTGWKPVLKNGVQAFRIVEVEGI
jgi:hypothetical protein